VAFQTAIATGNVIIPYSAAGYMIRTCLNATNLQSLFIRGAGNVMPIEGTAYAMPAAGTTLLGGTGGAVIDITGSNSVTIADLNISSLGVATTPSTIGIIGGTSTGTGSGAPGGAGYVLENVTVAMAYVGVALPIYFNNANLCRFMNVSTIGKHGIALVSSNPLGISPVYTAWGAAIGSDSNYGSGCYLVGYGESAVLWLEGSYDIQFNETYLTYAAASSGKVTYSGSGYALRVSGCSNCSLKVSNDYFPYLFIFEGICDKIDVDGLTMSGTGTGQPGGGQPAIGAFLGTIVKQCRFRVTPFGPYTNAPFHYNTIGSPIMASFANCEFIFDTGGCANVISFNMTAAAPVPIFNCRINGNTDSAPITLQVTGVAATNAQLRYFLNGLRVGTA
jgi:hypothetical protein